MIETVRFWIDDVNCNGTESRLVDCEFEGYGVDSCNYGISLWCVEDEINGTQGALRLADSSWDNTFIKGRLEVFNGAWGTVCNTGFGIIDAAVACRELGYWDGGARVNYDYGNADGTGPIWMKDVDCTGKEQSLVDCPFSGFGNTRNCYHYDDIHITCRMEMPEPPVSPQGDLRLGDMVTGNNDVRGRLELFNKGQWGTICNYYYNSNFSDREAAVACKQLGYSPVGASVISNSGIGIGSGPIWSRDAICVGTEDYLVHCHLDGLDSPTGADCYHDYDVAIRCNLSED